MAFALGRCLLEEGSAKEAAGSFEEDADLCARAGDTAGLARAARMVAEALLEARMPRRAEGWAQRARSAAAAMAPDSRERQLVEELYTAVSSRVAAARQAVAMAAAPAAGLRGEDAQRLLAAAETAGSLEAWHRIAAATRVVLPTDSDRDVLLLAARAAHEAALAAEGSSRMRDGLSRAVVLYDAVGPARAAAWLAPCLVEVGNAAEEEEGGLAQAQASYERAAALAERAGHWDVAWTAHNNLAFLHDTRRQDAAGVRRAEEAAARAAEQGRQTGLAPQPTEQLGKKMAFLLHRRGASRSGKRQQLSAGGAAHPRRRRRERAWAAPVPVLTTGDRRGTASVGRKRRRRRLVQGSGEAAAGSRPRAGDPEQGGSLMEDEEDEEVDGGAGVERSAPRHASHAPAQDSAAAVALSSLQRAAQPCVTAGVCVGSLQFRVRLPGRSPVRELRRCVEGALLDATGAWVAVGDITRAGECVSEGEEVGYGDQFSMQASHPLEAALRYVAATVTLGEGPHPAVLAWLSQRGAPDADAGMDLRCSGLSLGACCAAARVAADLGATRLQLGGNPLDGPDELLLLLARTLCALPAVEAQCAGLRPAHWAALLRGIAEQAEGGTTAVALRELRLGRAVAGDGEVKAALERLGTSVPGFAWHSE